MIRKGFFGTAFPLFVLMISTLMLSPVASNAQDGLMASSQETVTVDEPEKVEFGIEGDIVSKYLWRGQNYAGISVQPCVWVGYKGFSLSVWGTAGFTKEDMAEIDLTLSYENNGFYASITDYWCAYYGDGTKYFRYRSEDTPHVFEATVGYDFGFLDINWNTNFAGADGCTEKGRRAYSSYFQANVPFSLWTIDWDATVGLTPWGTDYYYNATGFAVCDVSLQATREFKISDSFSFSVFAKYCVNPSTMQTYILGGISF